MKLVTLALLPLLTAAPTTATATSTAMTSTAAAKTKATAAPAAFAIEDVAVEVGDGTRLERATVVVDGGVIVEVLVPGAAAPRLPAARVDGRGRVLSPGLVAVGSQVGLFDVGMEAAVVDSGLEGPATPAFRAVDGFNPLSVHVAVDRDEGVTTAVLSPSEPKLFSGQGFVVSLDGRLAGAVTPATRPAPVAMFGAFNGRVADAWGGSRGGVLLALREIVADARLVRARRADVDRGDTRALRLSPTQLQALGPVLDRAVPWVVAVDRASDIVAVLDTAADERLRVVVEGGAESWLVAPRLKDAGVPVIVHPSTAGRVDFEALSARDDLATALFDAGVTVVLAGWDSENGTTRVRQEAGLAVQNGLPHAAAIAAITSVPAGLFPRGDGAVVGQVQKGAVADLVLWSGDPLEVQSVAEHVWIAGREDPTPSRPRQLAERYRRRQR